MYRLHYGATRNRTTPSWIIAPDNCLPDYFHLGQLFPRQMSLQKLPPGHLLLVTFLPRKIALNDCTWAIFS